MFWTKKAKLIYQQAEQKQKELEGQNKILENLINVKTNELNRINYNLRINRNALNEIKQELNILNGINEIQELGIIYNPNYNNLDIIKQKETEIIEKLAKLVQNKEHINIIKEYRLNGSVLQGSKFQYSFSDGIIIGFNTYFEKKRKAISKSNYYKTVELIEKKFNSYNNKAKIMGIEINSKYLELCKNLLSISLDDKIAKEEEGERIKENKKQLKEQEQLLIEAEKERKKLEDERHNLQKLFSKAITKQEQNKIKEKLAEVDKRVEEVDWRVSHYSAGWLYITTTQSMPGIMKIGCTRQLNPLNRLAQLSSASVPFPFECRGLVFSENVFDLEAKIHNRLDDKRVNKDNKLKEFFYGKPEEAIKILTDEFHEKVRFIDEKWIDNEGEDYNANLYL